MPKDEEEARALGQAQLLTTKPVLYVCNVEEASAASGNAHSAAVQAMATNVGAGAVIISAAIEAEVAMMDGLPTGPTISKPWACTETGLARVVRAAYALARPDHFFHRGAEGSPRLDSDDRIKGPAGCRRHSRRFRKGLHPCRNDGVRGLCASSMARQGAKEAGKYRSEGKEYVVHDGDVMLFRFNV